MANRNQSAVTEFALYGFLALGTFLLYAPTLNYDFVFWDDHVNIVKNPIVQSGFSSMEGVFSTSQSVRFVPLTWLGYKLIHSMNGMDPGGFHFANVFLHLINTLLLAGIFKRVLLLRSPIIDTGAKKRCLLFATAGAAIWSWTPLRVEPVAWANDLGYHLASLNLLLSIYCCILYYSSRSRMALFGSALFYGLSLCSYPTTLTWPAAIPIFWALLSGQPNGKSWKDFFIHAVRCIKESLPLWMPAVLIAVPVLVLTLIARYHEQTNWYSAENQYLPWPARPLSVLYYFSGMLQRMFFPVNLTPAGFKEANVIGLYNTVIALVFIAFVLWLVSKRTLEAMRICVVLIFGLLSSGSILGVTEGNVFPPDRYAYLLQAILMIGMFLVLPGAWLSTKTAISNSVLGLSAAVLVAYVPSNLSQQRIWEDSYTLFEHIRDVPWVNESPDRMLQIDLMEGRKLMQDKRYDDALALYYPLIRSHPIHEAVYFTAIAEFLKGRLDRALKVSTDGLILWPDSHELMKINQDAKQRLKQRQNNPTGGADAPMVQ